MTIENWEVMGQRSQNKARLHWRENKQSPSIESRNGPLSRVYRKDTNLKRRSTSNWCESGARVTTKCGKEENWAGVKVKVRGPTSGKNIDFKTKVELLYITGHTGYLLGGLL